MSHLLFSDRFSDVRFVLHDGSEVPAHKVCSYLSFLFSTPFLMNVIFLCLYVSSSLFVTYHELSFIALGAVFLFSRLYSALSRTLTVCSLAASAKRMWTCTRLFLLQTFPRTPSVRFSHASMESRHEISRLDRLVKRCLFLWHWTAIRSRRAAWKVLSKTRKKNTSTSPDVLIRSHPSLRYLSEHVDEHCVEQLLQLSLSIPAAEPLFGSCLLWLLDARNLVNAMPLLRELFVNEGARIRQFFLQLMQASVVADSAA
jgi:hypothetical protein